MGPNCVFALAILVKQENVKIVDRGFQTVLL